MGKLTDLKVERVDGVDKPAIKKRWVLVKSEDAPETVEKDYAGAARAAVEAIAKEGVSFSDETVEVLRALVEMLDLDIEFAAKSEDEPEPADDEPKTDDEPDADEKADEPDADEPKNEDVDDEDVEKTTYTAEEAEELVAKALRAAGVDPQKVVEKNMGEIGKITPSRRPEGQDDLEDRKVAKNKGEGLFTNVVFAKTTTLDS